MNIIRVSVSEAAKLFGVSQQTIRRAILDEELSYIVVAGRYKINFESLVKWSQKSTISKKAHKKGIGQYVDRWNIAGRLYSPSSKTAKSKKRKESDPKEDGSSD